MSTLRKKYLLGTHRLVTPECTLQAIRPLLREFGITRCADVTGLDSVGIPVYCAIRPRARNVQVSNGKGVSPDEANVSALMEAIELAHAEGVPFQAKCESLANLRRMSSVLNPSSLEGFRSEEYFADDYRVNWVLGDDLQSGKAVWVPASAVYYMERTLYTWSGNGLASGNHPLEATLHGLYEVVERNTISSLEEDNIVHFERAQVIDLESIRDEIIGTLCERVRTAGLRLVLLRPTCDLSIYTFIAALLDPNAFSHASTVNLGFGAHLSAAVAAVRAITEAAQSRLTFIHGAREDLNLGAYRGGTTQQMLFKFFDGLESDVQWNCFEDRSHQDLLLDYKEVLASLRQAGFHQIFCVRMSDPMLSISVVRVFIVGARRTIP